jgi:hypothetical protein
MSPELWGIVSGVLGAGFSLTGFFAIRSRSEHRPGEEDEIPSDGADEADNEPVAEPEAPDAAAEPTPSPDVTPPGALAPTGAPPVRAVVGATRSYRGRFIPLRLRRRRPSTAPSQAWATTIVSAAVSGAVGAGVGGIITLSLN